MGPQEPVLLAWSGGKDAAWALHVLRQRGVEVVALLTTVNADHDRVAMQGIRRDVLAAQARAAGLPLLEAPISSQCDNAAYEASFADALARAQARWPRAGTVAFGDLYLSDIRAWREALCARHGWRIQTPLFPADTAALARTMLRQGLVAHLTCVDTTQLDAAFAGHAFDDALLDALPPGCDPCGENGEFHTLVSAGPMLASPLQLVPGERVLRDGRFMYADFALAS